MDGWMNEIMWKKENKVRIWMDEIKRKIKLVNERKKEKEWMEERKLSSSLNEWIDE